MAFTGYSNSGKTYEIGSEKGINFINNAVSGTSLLGGDGSFWTKNSDGTTTIKKGDDTWTVGSALGNFQNALDAITQQSEKASARSLEYAQQNQQWSANQAQIANEFNAAEAAKNRDWQQYMSNTAHQREVADLKAAGLNPVLSAMGGNGASVTSGATASSNLPSGATGQSDMSANSALVSILGSMLAAQTQLTNAAVSARTQEAVADKYTAMEQIVALISANASMRNADVAANASKYGSYNNMFASLFGSILGSDTIRRGQNLGYQQNLNDNDTRRWTEWYSQLNQNSRHEIDSLLKEYGINADLFGRLVGSISPLLKMLN